MNKYLKWMFVVFAILSVVFVAGCAKSMIEDEAQSTGGYGVNKMMAVEGRTAIAAMPPVEMDMMYEEGYYKPAMDKANYIYPDDTHYGSGENIDVELKIIRTAHIGIEVDDYFLASQKAEAYAKKYGGYVSNSDARADYNNKHRGTITMRVPEIHFDAVIAELSLLGDIKSKTTGGNDVTEEYIDIQARKDNADAHEERLVSMYANATDVQEMMQVERELSRVREEIERYEGRLRYLDSKVDLSTITVELYEQTPVVKEWGIWTSMKNAFNHSLATLRWMIEFIGWMLPLIIIGFLIGLLVRWGVRRNRKVVSKRR